MEFTKKEVYELRKLSLGTLLAIMVVFLWSAFAWGYDILLYGSLDSSLRPEDTESYSLAVDLGDHNLSPGDWEKQLADMEISVVLPAQSDIDQNADLLDRLIGGETAVVVSDLLDSEGDPEYAPFFLYTENYHTVMVLNFLTPSPEFPDLIFEEIERSTPDKIVVVGTEKNAPILEDRFRVLADRIEFRDRLSFSVGHTETLVVEELPVMYFFWSSRCPSCRRMKYEISAPLVERYQDQIKVVYLDYVFGGNYERLVELEEFWQVDEKASVTVFTEAGYLASDNEDTFNQELEALILKTLGLTEEDRRVFPGGVLGQVEEILFQRLEGMTLWVVAGAGLVDGLNPCAFATIVFMVNLLLMLGHDRRRILEIGVTYSAAVYVTYFLLGLLFFQVWQVLEGYYIVSRVIYGVMASLLLVFAVFSIRDAIQYKKDKKETGFSMGLPKGMRVKINQYLKKSFSDRKLIVAALLSGVVISFLEAGCTGQIYFPIIMLIHAETTYRLRAIMYLLLYNAFFVVPLLVVFVTVFYGSQSKALVSFGRKNILYSKLALAGLFIVLSILLWETALI